MKYLGAMKNKKGFTVVELVVVIAIIGILVMVIMTAAIGGGTDKVLSANTNASVFLTSTQLTFTRAQLTERSIVTYGSTDTKYIEYKDGANTTGGKYLFVEVKSTKQGMQYLHIANTLTALMTRGESDSMTTLENYLMAEEESRMSDSYEGYFYAMIDSSFRVKCTHFAEYRFPTKAESDTLEKFRDKFLFSPANQLVGGNGIVGTCSDAASYGGVSGTQYAFDAPSKVENSALYTLIFGV